MKLVDNKLHVLRAYSTMFHIFGILLSGFSLALTALYGSMDSNQHALLPPWVTYLIYFFIFLGAFIGRFIKQ